MASTTKATRSHTQFPRPARLLPNVMMRYTVHIGEVLLRYLATSGADDMRTVYEFGTQSGREVLEGGDGDWDCVGSAH